VSQVVVKQAIVEGLAIKIFEGDCPRNLQDKRIVSLDMTSIVEVQNIVVNLKNV